MTTMRAARWYGAGDVRVEDVPRPAITGPGQVVVKVATATICASDLAEWRDGPHVIPTRAAHPLTGQHAPVTLGHEFAGRVVAASPDVSGLTDGQRVCADACIRCGNCYWCLRGEYNICRIGGSIGLHQDGALAEFVRVPAYTLRPLPDRVSDRDGSIVEPLAVGLHALRRARMEAGDSVAVIGLGMIGAATVLLARALGARRVIVLEPSPHRAKVAELIGADTVLATGPDSARAEVRQLTDGIGADVVVDCTGSSVVLPSAVELARRGGRVAICGISHTPSELRSDRLVYFEREVVGCLGYRFDHDAVIAMIASGALPLDPLFGRAIVLGRLVEDGFERMVNDPSAPLRIQIEVGAHDGL